MIYHGENIYKIYTALTEEDRFSEGAAYLCSWRLGSGIQFLSQPCITQRIGGLWWESVKEGVSFETDQSSVLGQICGSTEQGKIHLGIDNERAIKYGLYLPSDERHLIDPLGKAWNRAMDFIRLAHSHRIIPAA